MPRSGELQGVNNNVLKTTLIFGLLLDPKKGGRFSGFLPPGRALVCQLASDALCEAPENKNDPVLGFVGPNFEMLRGVFRDQFSVHYVCR